MKSSHLPVSIHFIGVGGAGMNPLASICCKLGLHVSGSDREYNVNHESLLRQGAKIWNPHNLLALKELEIRPELVVSSTAISSQNPELEFLVSRGLESIHRSELLRRLASGFDERMVISGTHGKTTTTAMLAWIVESQLGPNAAGWIIGGNLADLGESEIFGRSFSWPDMNSSDSSSVLVMEGDESDASFLRSDPTHALVTSLEPDHLENYDGSFARQIASFREFAVKAEKLFIANVDCPNVRKHLGDLATETYAVTAHADWTLKHVSGEPVIYYRGEEQGILEVPTAPGRHNHSNALGAIAMANSIGICTQDSLHCLREFPGVYRRLEVIVSDDRGPVLLDDYAHHPTEVRSALQAGRELLFRRGDNDGRLIALFQPHLPTRVRDLWTEFTECFVDADYLLLSDIYQARGEPIAGIDSYSLSLDIKQENVIYCPGEPEKMLGHALELWKRGDVMMILGAGNITRIRETLGHHLTSNKLLK